MMTDQKMEMDQDNQPQHETAAPRSADKNHVSEEGNAKPPEFLLPHDRHE